MMRVSVPFGFVRRGVLPRIEHTEGVVEGQSSGYVVALADEPR